jgi:hypothetical protein
MAKKQQQEEKPTKFTRVYEDEEGFKAIWTFDHKISKVGPIKVEVISYNNEVSFKGRKKKEKITKKKRKKVANLKN